MTQTVPDISPLMPMHQDPLLVYDRLAKKKLKRRFGGLAFFFANIISRRLCKYEELNLHQNVAYDIPLAAVFVKRNNFKDYERKSVAINIWSFRRYLELNATFIVDSFKLLQTAFRQRKFEDEYG